MILWGLTHKFKQLVLAAVEHINLRASAAVMQRDSLRLLSLVNVPATIKEELELWAKY